MKIKDNCQGLLGLVCDYKLIIRYVFFLFDKYNKNNQQQNSHILRYAHINIGTLCVCVIVYVCVCVCVLDMCIWQGCIWLA